MADFHELLNKLRIEKGVTQEEVATAIGVAKSTFAKYDRGEREPNFETLKKNSTILSDYNRLFTGFVRSNAPG